MENLDITNNEEISVVIITYGRVELLNRCLRSIFESILPKSLSLIIVINGYDKETLKFLEDFSKGYQNSKFFLIEKTTRGKARNEALKYTKGKIIYFLDDDIMVERNLFRNIIEKAKSYQEVDIFGGPNLTPSWSTLFQKCSGYVFGSVFGAAKMRRRYIIMPGDKLVDDKSLILCNLAIRKRLFDKEKILFNEEIVCNEENLFLYKLKSKGYKMLYSPNLVVYHRRRKNLWEFCRQYFTYGKGRMQQTYYLPSSLPLFVILPSFFLLYLISLLFFHKFFYLFPLFIYFLLNLIFSFTISLKERNIIYFFLSFIMFISGHISYGLGFLSGLIKKGTYATVF